MHIGAFVGDDERTLELAHIRRVNAEISLQRDVDMHTLGHVYERSARPCGGVQRRELVVVARNAFAEVFPDDFRIPLHGGVGVDEDHALIRKLLLDRVVDDFGFVLCGDAGNKAALFGFRNAQLVIGVADFLRQLVPSRGLFVEM